MHCENKMVRLYMRSEEIKTNYHSWKISNETVWLH